MTTLSTSDLADSSTDSAKQERAREVEEIFREHHRFAYRTAYAITGSGADAEDVVQTIFLRLLRQEFPADLKKNPGAYVYRAAVNMSLNLIRGKQRQLRTLDRVAQEGRPVSLESDSAEDIHRRLYAAVDQLGPEASHIVILRYAHNYSDAQIAKLLGVSRTTIAVRLYRARARLRKLLGMSGTGEMS